jgi:hypothetical protein
MKTTIFTLIFVSIFSFSLFADPGDTVFVKTFTFDSINTRRGTFPFPPEQSWEKIMMYYTIKCDAATTWDSYACGEWDYTTYTNVYEHTGLLDSTQYSHKKYTHNNYDFTEFKGTAIPKYHKTEKSFTKTNYSFSDFSAYNTGIPGANTVLGFAPENADANMYLLYNAQTMEASGFPAGPLTGLSLYSNYAGLIKMPVKIKIAHTNLNVLSLSDVANISFTTVYDGELNYAGGAGKIPFDFSTAFNYDGTSGIIIEISAAANPYNISFQTEFKDHECVLYTGQHDYYINFENYSYIDIPAEVMPATNNEITICMWAYGNEAIQPQNDMLFEAFDDNGQRQLCLHYPWSNGSIYWDAGNSGGGYDRIDKAAIASEYEGKWNHIALTKNTLTGSMKIYINGVLWHSGTGKTQPIQNISTFILGCAGNKDQNYAYDGSIDDFCVWDKELTAQEIQDIMYTRPDHLSSTWDNLLVYYSFDEAPGQGYIINDLSDNNQTAEFWGTLSRKSYQGENRFKNFNLISYLPVLELYTGTYTTTEEEQTYVDSVLINQQIIREFENIDDYTIGLIGTAVYYPEYELVTNLANETDTIYFTPDITISNSNLVYYSQPFELINTIQLQNYVTPYGIGLNIGSNGFTHVYDVSDYAGYLKDMVDICAHNTQELIDVTFAFIEGIPPRKVVQFDQVYLGNFGQYNIANDISLPTKKIKRNPNATMFNVKTRTTGHGMAGAGNCSEFCPTWHNISVEGVETNEWYNWTSCAGNPIFPQGGTWIFDRAGWCPGSFADTYDWEITPYVSNLDSVELDYGMTQYGIGAGEGNYNVSMQLVQYSDPSFTNDAAIEAVTAPNNADLYKRYNPICKNPEIIIKNTGSNDLQSLLIEYGLNGDYSYSYQWTGELGFLETETVILPIIQWQEFVEYNDFNVRVSLPNLEEDEYPANNTYKTTFTTVDIWTVTNTLVVLTNNFGSETSYTVTDADGNVLVDRHGLASNTMYYDTLDFAPGCYDIRLYDTGEDGFDFWYYDGADGTGYMRLRKMGAGYVKNFPLDFGSFIHYQFVIPDVTYIINEELNKEYFEIFPNPNDGNFKLKLNFEPEENTIITITDMSGRIVRSLSDKDLNSDEININLENISKGFYLINLQSGGVRRTKKLVVGNSSW